MVTKETLQIIKAPDGLWLLTDRDAAVLGTYPTNAEAWRAYDRLLGEPISKAEDRADWFAENAAEPAATPAVARVNVPQKTSAS
jgi:hypothetical protein